MMGNQPFLGELRYLAWEVEVSNAANIPSELIRYGKEYGTHTETRRRLQQFDGANWRDIPDHLSATPPHNPQD